MDWVRILAYVTGMVDQELMARIEYLAAENRILKAQSKGRLQKPTSGAANGDEMHARTSGADMSSIRLTSEKCQERHYAMQQIERYEVARRS